MDKRSLLFVFLLTITLFFVHHWFNAQDEARAKQIAALQKQQVSEGEKKRQKDIEARTAPLSALPLAKLFSDANGSTLATLAVRVEDQYLALSWNTSPPQTLYVEQDKKYVPLKLRVSARKINMPILYGATDAKLKIASNSLEGRFDLQILTFSDQNSRAHLVLGESESDQIFIPLNKPSDFGIALYKIGSEYLPYAIYDPSEAKLRLLGEYPYFGSIVQAAAISYLPPDLGENQAFYVLENGYQQIVFSSIGAAITEINLPFHSPDHPESVVHAIGFDRILKDKYPQNAYFPQTVYSVAVDGTIKKQDTRTLGGYYPLLRRNIVGPGGRLSIAIPPRYTAFNIVSQDPALATLPYKLVRLEKNMIEFEARTSNRRILKRFSFPDNPQKAPYCINLLIKIEGDAKDLWLTSGVPEVELISDSFSPTLQYRFIRNQKGAQKGVIEQIDLPKTTLNFPSVSPDWVCNSNGFFGLILDPISEIGAGLRANRIPGEFDPTRLILIDAQYQLYPIDKYPGYEMQLPLTNAPNGMEFRIYAGPLTSSILKTVDATYSDPKADYYTDYADAQSSHGWFSFISEPFAQFLFVLMKFFYFVTHSWGISIILLTVALRVMLYPLNAWSIKSTSKMQEIAPQVSALQAKYKKDPKRAQAEIVALYREKGVNPFSGCFPILIQLPFLIGMFDLLKSTFVLRGASFIPHWIDNLTAPDVLFSWHYPILFFGSDFHLLPFLIGFVMFWQQKFSSPLPKDKTLWTDQQKQQKLMGNIMTIVFTVMFYHFPSGLNLYWLFSMLLGILQQWFMTKRKAQVKTT